MFIKNNSQSVNNKSLFNYWAFTWLMLVLLNTNLLANDFKRYEFPSLENSTIIDESQYNNSYNTGNNASSSYYQQPQYIFPELEKNQQVNQHKRHYSSRYNYPIKEQQNSQFSSQSNSQPNYIDRYQYNKNSIVQQPNNQSNYNPNYTNSNGSNYSSFSFNPVNPYNNQTNPWNMSDSFTNNPFLNKGYFPGNFNNNTNNNAWNPFNNSLSTWPNFNNGMMNNPMQNYPNIRTPGFFSK